MFCFHLQSGFGLIEFFGKLRSGWTCSVQPPDFNGYEKQKFNKHTTKTQTIRFNRDDRIDMRTMREKVLPNPIQE